MFFNVNEKVSWQGKDLEQIFHNTVVIAEIRYNDLDYTIWWKINGRDDVYLCHNNYSRMR